MRTDLIRSINQQQSKAHRFIDSFTVTAETKLNLKSILEFF